MALVDLQLHADPSKYPIRRYISFFKSERNLYYLFLRSQFAENFDIPIFLFNTPSTSTECGYSIGDFFYSLKITSIATLSMFNDIHFIKRYLWWLSVIERFSYNMYKCMAQCTHYLLTPSTVVNGNSSVRIPKTRAPNANFL